MNQTIDINLIAGHACAMIERGITTHGRFNVDPIDAVKITLRTFGLVERALTSGDSDGKYAMESDNELSKTVKDANESAGRREDFVNAEERKLVKVALEEAQRR